MAYTLTDPFRTLRAILRFNGATFLLLAAGIIVMALLYTGWGLWEITSLPPATLP